MDSEDELICAVREGRLKKVEQTLSSLDTQIGYNLLCVAIESRHKEITKLILDSNYIILCKDIDGYLINAAVENNDIKLLNRLLVGASYISLTDKFLCTPLHLAVTNGNKDIIKILLKHYVEINAKDILNTTALEYAIIEGQTEMVNFLIDSNAELQNSETPQPEMLIRQVADVNYAIDGLSCIHMAAQRGYLKIVEHLIQCGASINAVCTADLYKGYTALHFACAKRRHDVVQLLLSNGANVNALSEHNITPLQIAASKGNENIVKILLDHGANVDAQDANGKSVLRAAAEKGYSLTVDCILKYSPDVNNESNRSSLITALRGYGKKYRPVVYSLVSYGFTIRPEELPTDHTLLSAAIEKDCVKLVQTFLLCNTEKLSACINCLFRDDQTLLHFACENGGGEVVNFLLQNGGDVNALTENMLSPLLIATSVGNEKAVKELLNYGANVDDQDRDGKTVLYLAAEKGYLLIVDHILRHCPNVNNEYNKKALRAAILSVTNSYSFYDKYNSNISVIDHFFRRGFIIGVDDIEDNEILQAAIMKGYVNVVEYFLKYGANVNMSNMSMNCCTPLHYAAKYKQKDVALLLIKHGAKVNAKDSTGKTPIFYAVSNTIELIKEVDNMKYTELEIDFNWLGDIVEKECTKCREVIELLLQFGAYIDPNHNNEITALNRLASSETVLYESKLAAIAELLLRNGANFNAPDQNGKTTLHISVEHNNTLLSKILLKYGAVINLNHKNDVELLFNAVYHNNLKFVKYLLKLGANVNSVNESNETPLHKASEKGYKQLVLTLLDCGADVNIMTTSSETALERAMHGYSLYYCKDYPNNYLCEDVFNILRRYIVQLNCANLYVNKEDLEYLTCEATFHIGYINNVDKEIVNFQSKCEKEIKTIKDEIVGNSNISLYDVLTLDTAKLGVLIKNENIIQALTTYDYKTKFPIYSRMMSSRIRRAIEKTKLLKQCITFFHIFYNTSPRLPDECVEIILSYLTEQELKFLIANSLEFGDVLNLL